MAETWHSGIYAGPVKTPRKLDAGVAISSLPRISIFLWKNNQTISKWLR